jgi:hypothetical protein
VDEWARLQGLAPPGPTLKASLPGPYTLSGRLVPNADYADRYAIAEALVPIAQGEPAKLVDAGCGELAIDEPSMSCYAYREDTARLVDLFNRTVAPVAGRCRLSTHLCFGNYRGHAVGPRRYGPMFPAFLGLDVEEIHLELASRELAELELIGPIAEVKDVAVGLVDVRATTSRRRPTSPRACVAVSSTRRPSGWPSRRTAASARPPAGRRGRSCAPCVQGFGRYARSSASPEPDQARMANARAGFSTSTARATASPGSPASSTRSTRCRRNRLSR